jgi:hypothetical protein
MVYCCLDPVPSQTRLAFAALAPLFNLARFRRFGCLGGALRWQLSRHWSRGRSVRGRAHPRTLMGMHGYSFRVGSQGGAPEVQVNGSGFRPRRIRGGITLHYTVSRFGTNLEAYPKSVTSRPTGRADWSNPRRTHCANRLGRTRRLPPLHSGSARAGSLATDRERSTNDR